MSRLKLITSIFQNHSITSIYVRSILMIFLIVLVFAGYAIYSEYNSFDDEAKTIRESYIQEQKERIVFDVHRVLGFIENEYLALRYKLDSETLKKQIINAISQLYGRPDKTGYIFIYDYNGTCLSDPVQPHNIGKNLYTHMDPNGTQVIKELIDRSKNVNGGFVEYIWIKPTTKEISPKISYAKAFEPWEWMVGTGVYLDEVDKAIASKKELLKNKLLEYLFKIAVLLSLLFVIGLIGVKVVNYIIRKEIDRFNLFFKRASKEHILIDKSEVRFKEFKKMVSYINSMVREIHNRKDKLSSLNRSLEKKVAEKTQDLLKQNRLLANEKALTDSLVKSQDQFIKRSIHEMNTPLAVIMTHIDIYRMKHGENRYMSHIEAGAKMIATLYDDLSYMVKKNRFVYVKKNINFSEFLHQRVRFFHEIARGNKQSIKTNIEESLYVHFSDIELQRIIDNNLSNAIKYARRSSVIEVALYTNKDKIVLEFSSQSSKIENVDKIFEPYHREDSLADGFGLGLEIVKSICDESGVIIDVSSNEERTIFRYYFAEVNN